MARILKVNTDQDGSLWGKQPVSPDSLMARFSVSSGHGDEKHVFVMFSNQINNSLPFGSVQIRSPISSNSVTPLTVTSSEKPFDFDLDEMKLAMSSGFVEIPDEIVDFDFFEEWLEQF